MERVTNEEYSFVFEQGDMQSLHFFVIESGEIQVLIDGLVIRTLGRGSCFGEIALLYNHSRTASIAASKNSTFWVLNRKNFKKIVNEISQKNHQENRDFIEGVSFFSNSP